MTYALPHTREHPGSADRALASHFDHAAFHNQGAPPRVRGGGRRRAR